MKFQIAEPAGGVTMRHGSLAQRFITRRSSGFILAFHGISAERLDHLIGGIRPAQPIPLAELVQRSKAGKPTSGLFAITVDDGVGDVVRDLARLFRIRGWPATFYLPTQYIATQEPMAWQWWRVLRPLLAGKRLELKSGIADFSRPKAIDETARRMEQLWHSRHIEEYLPLMLEFAEALREQGTTPAVLRPEEPITCSEVAEMSRSDLLSFESHSVSHSAMSALEEEELVLEMGRSRDLLSEWTGRECRHFAYPFGSSRSISCLAVAVARRFYDSAVTMMLGGVDLADPWMLPRIPLYPDNSVLFAQMKILLKCRVAGAERLNQHGTAVTSK